MDSVSPVFTEKEVHLEKVIALEQEQYFPIIGLPVIFSDLTEGVAVRFRLSEEERELITNGGDIIFTELTFGRLFTPMSIKIAKPDQYADDMICEEGV